MFAIQTFCEAYLVGTIASFYNSNTVFLAVIITAAMVGALTLFAVQVCLCVFLHFVEAPDPTCFALCVWL